MRRAVCLTQVTQGTKETGSKVIGRLPIFAASLEFSPNLAEVAASFQRKEQEKLQLKTRTPTVDSASVEFLNPFNAGKKALKTVEIPMEDRLERGKSSGMNSISVLLREISTLMKQDSVHVVTAVCWLKALIHSHTSQLMALGSENLLANSSTCLAIIEYRVQHANSLSK
ncbi:hypothetical protein quinque_013789 [Culex quinquefasciatus]